MQSVLDYDDIYKEKHVLIFTKKYRIKLHYYHNLFFTNIISFVLFFSQINISSAVQSRFDHCFNNNYFGVKFKTKEICVQFILCL